VDARRCARHLSPLSDVRFPLTEALSRRAWVIPLAGLGAGIGLSFATVAIIARSMRRWCPAV